MWVYDSVTSPCIDRGDPAGYWTAELWPHGKRVNLGAYGGTPQASLSLSLVGNPADLNFDNNVNLKDYYLWSSRWLTQQNLLHEDFNRNGIVDAPDACIFAENWLWATSSLIAYWNLDETAGDIAHDQAGSSVHGTLRGDAAWTADHINNALALDGSGDWVDLGASNILKTQLPISMAAWIKLSEVGNYQILINVDKKDVDSSHRFYGFDLLILNTGQLAASFGDGQPDSSIRYQIGNTILQPCTWYHVAAVLQDTDNISLYVNGQYDGGTPGGAGGPLVYADGSSQLGSRNGNSFFLHGDIDDVRIYNTALTEDDIQALADN